MKTYLIIASVFSLFWLPSAFSKQISGTVDSLSIDSVTGVTKVQMKGTFSFLGTPACAPGVVIPAAPGTTVSVPVFTADSYVFTITDEKSLVGQEQVSALMAAKAKGSTVTLVGAGNCNRLAGFENISTLGFLP